jgi:large subunit ribosomal protein L18
MNIQEKKQRKRIRRKFAIRKKIVGTPEKPRLTVYRSLSHVYAQIIDDTNGKTLASASTLDTEIKASIKPETKKSEQSKLVGQAVARKAIEKNIAEVCFDRNGYLYHGRVKALADGARDAGLKF